jgi:hypothetical protein
MGSEDHADKHDDLCLLSEAEDEADDKAIDEAVDEAAFLDQNFNGFKRVRARR